MKTEYFECACFSSEHTIRFVLDDDPEDPSLYLEVQLNQYRNIFKRILVSIKYIFGYRCRYGHWDCWLLDQRDTTGLINLFQKYQKLTENKIPPTFIGNPRKD